MINKIDYLEVEKEFYETRPWYKEEVSEKLEGKTIINVETRKLTIRFWYQIKD